MYKLHINDRTIENVDIEFSYDEKGMMTFHLGDFFEFEDIFSDKNIKIQYRKDSAESELLVLKAQVGEKTIATAIPSVQPLNLSQSTSADKFVGVLLSPPNFYNRKIELLSSSGTQFSLLPVKESKDDACIVTFNLAEKTNEPLQATQTLLYFLSFTKGSDCGVGHVFGYSENGDLIPHALGFTGTDKTLSNTNWHGHATLNLLPKIFELFSSSFQDTITKQALKQTITFYRASNASKNVSNEMAIIASHSALEAIVNYVLSYRAGWSKRLMSTRQISFSDKCRTASVFMGLTSDILPQNYEIAKLLKENRFEDAFDVISYVRNKLVHQDLDQPLSGLQKYEALQLSQWLVEVLLLRSIGFEGKIMDRRVFDGWRGATCEIPQ